MGAGLHSRAMWLLPAILAMVAMAPALAGEFVRDNRVAVVGSECVTGAFDPATIFSRNFWCQAPGSENIDAWRPWPVAVWWLLWQLGGGAPWPFHLLVIALHVLCTVQLVRVARYFAPIEYTSSAALIAGAWFAVMPIHADAVASVVGVADVWALLWGLVGVDQFMVALRARRPLRPAALCLLALLLAMLSKESAIVFAPLLAVLAVLGPRGPAAQADPEADTETDTEAGTDANTGRNAGTRSEAAGAAARVRRRAVAIAGLALAAVALYVVTRAAMVGTVTATRVSFEVNPLVEAPYWMRLPMALDILWRYLALAVTGGPLSADYSYNAVPVVTFGPGVALGGLVAAGLLTLLWRCRRQPGIRALVLWFAGAGALLAHLIAPLPAIFAERLFYGASAPLCLLAGVLVAPLVAPAARMRRLMIAGGVAYLALLTILAAVHAHAWTTDDGITRASVANTPHSARAQLWRARYLAEKGQAEMAAEHSRAALAILPEWGRAHAILASTLDMQGQPEQALVAFQQAFQLDPRHHEIADLFIQFLLRYGHTAQARIIYQRHAEARGTADPQVRVPP